MAELTLHLTVTAAPGAPRVPLTIEPSIKACDLRTKASEATKIPKSALKLIFRGRLLVDDDKEAVAEYKLEDGSVLHCMGKPEASGATTQATAAPAAAPAAAASLPIPVPPVAATDPLSDALQAIRRSTSPEEYKTALTTLDKILSNVQQHPLEDKYRKVKRQNPAFQRRLGKVGHEAMLAVGFIVAQDDDGQEIYQMQATPDAWPKLVAAKGKVEAALRELQPVPSAPLGMAAGMPGFPGMPSGGLPGGLPLGGLPPGGLPPGGMDAAMANLMSDPAALQNMIQSPMFQHMIRNDPRIANDPQMRQAMEMMASNPEMVQQMSQMMQDPMMRQQMEAMMQRTGGGPPIGGGMPAPRAAPPQPPRSDEEMTEEEMIAEAIRRSMQDGQN